MQNPERLRFVEQEFDAVQLELRSVPQTPFLMFFIDQPEAPGIYKFRRVHVISRPTFTTEGNPAYHIQVRDILQDMSRDEQLVEGDLETLVQGMVEYEQSQALSANPEQNQYYAAVGIVRCGGLQIPDERLIQYAGIRYHEQRHIFALGISTQA